MLAMVKNKLDFCLQIINPPFLHSCEPVNNRSESVVVVIVTVIILSLDWR